MQVVIKYISFRYPGKIGDRKIRLLEVFRSAP